MKNKFVYDIIEHLNLNRPFFDVNIPPMYSQSGEDIIIAAILNAIAIKNKENISNYTYLEIGANHPISTSSTYLLHRKFSMTGVLVEANPFLVDELQWVRSKDKVINVAVSDEDIDEVILKIPEASELATIDNEFLDAWTSDGAQNVKSVTVKATRINNILKSEFPINGPQFISIDIEGKDLNILKDIDFSTYRPCIIQIEPSEHFIEGSGNRMIEYMLDKNYTLIAKTDINLIFIDKN